MAPADERSRCAHLHEPPGSSDDPDNSGGDCSSDYSGHSGGSYDWGSVFDDWYDYGAPAGSFRGGLFGALDGSYAEPGDNLALAAPAGSFRGGLFGALDGSYAEPGDNLALAAPAGSFRGGLFDALDGSYADPGDNSGDYYAGSAYTIDGSDDQTPAPRREKPLSA